MINTKGNLKHRLMAVRFAIWDLHLYLDTHMGDCTALELVDEYKKKYLDDPFFKEYPSWVAHYYIPRLTEGEEWLMWQCSDLGVIPGIKEKVDINIFNGSEKQFKALLIDKK